MISLPPSQIARLSSLGVVILSEILSPGVHLTIPGVRNVLQGWIAHGDVAAVWLTLQSRIPTVHNRMSSESFPTGLRDWLLRWVQQQRGLSVSRAVRRQGFCRQTGSAGHVCFWVTIQETSFAGCLQRPCSHDLGSTMRQPWQRVHFFGAVASAAWDFGPKSFSSSCSACTFCFLCCLRACSLIPCEGQLE